MLVAVEYQILSDELVDYQILFRKFRPVGCGAIESSKYFRSDLSSDLREDPSLLQSLFQNFLEFINRSHFKLLLHNEIIIRILRSTALFTILM